MDKEELFDSLKFLGELLDANRTPEIHLVVSGGAALISQGFISRSTNDVDVFARREIEGDMVPGDPLPAWFKQHIVEVAKAEDLQENWLNSMTSFVFPGMLEILPAKCWIDVHRESFGERLHLSFLGRTALIYLKIYARITRLEDRDRADLLALNPSGDEIDEVCAWLVDEKLAEKSRAAAVREDLRS